MLQGRHAVTAEVIHSEVGQGLVTGFAPERRLRRGRGVGRVFLVHAAGFRALAHDDRAPQEGWRCGLGEPSKPVAGSERRGETRYTGVRLRLTRRRGR